MVEGKTVPGLAANLAAGVAFKKLLKVRFLAVSARIKTLDVHAESVHQLRVSTRRASAALRLAKDSLPAKRRQRANDLLRKVRRSAGAVRDTDIYLETILAANGLSDSTKAFLAGHMAYSRAVNFESLQAVTVDALPEFVKLGTTLVANVEASDETLNEVLFRSAKKLLRDFDDSLNEAAASLDAAHLHQVRIQGKRLRYMLELLPEGKLEVVTAQVEKLQEILGLWNDVHAVNERLATASFAASSVNGAAGSPVMKGIDALARNNARVETRQLAAFRRWLKAWIAFRKRTSVKSLFAVS